MMKRSLTKAVAEKDVQQALIRPGFEPIVDSGPEAGQRAVASELKRWAPVIKATSFKT